MAAPGRGFDPATYACEVGRLEDEPVYIRLRSAQQNNTAGGVAAGDAAGPESATYEFQVMPFSTWQVVKRRFKEKFQALKNVPDSNIRLLHKSVELRNGSLVDDYNMDGGTAERPMELQYLIIDQGHENNRKADRHFGLYVAEQVPCTTSMKERVAACLAAIQSGIQPRLTEEGTGATYMLRDTSNRHTLAVFKPKDEEAFAPQNPRGYVGPENTAGLRQGVLSTQQAAREVAAYLLDHEKFAGVPETTLVHGKHPKFVKVKGKGDSMKVVWKIGAFQTFLETKETSGNFAPQVFLQQDVHRIGILDVRIVNLDRNDGNLLVRSSRTTSGTRYELIPIDHGLSLPDRLEVYTDDIAWMSWPQASKPFGERELTYIRNLNGSRDAKLLSKCLGIRRECLRLMEVTTKLLQIGAEHGLTLYEIGTILFRDAGASDSSTARSRLEIIIDQCVDMAIAVAGDGAAFKYVSSTLSGLDLSRAEPGTKAGNRRSELAPLARQTSQGGGVGEDPGLTPLLGPSSPMGPMPFASPLGSHADGSLGLDGPPHLSLDGLSASDAEEIEGEAAAGAGGGTRRRPSETTDKENKRGTYKGTMIRAGRTSAALMDRHREGEGGDTEGGIFCRPKMPGSSWTADLERAFRRNIATELTAYIRKHFPTTPSQREAAGRDEEGAETAAKAADDDDDDDGDTSLASALPKVMPTDSPAFQPADSPPTPPSKPPYVPPHMRSAAGSPSPDAPEAAACLAPKDGEPNAKGAADEEPAEEVVAPPPRKYVPPQQRRAEAEAAAAAAAAAAEAEGAEKPTASEPQKPKAPWRPSFMRKAMEGADAAATPSASSTAPSPPVSAAGGPASVTLPTDASAGTSRYGWCVNQGPRANMEDALDANERMEGSINTEFYAVYDGHSGQQAVKWLLGKLPMMISAHSGFGDPGTEKIEQVLHESFTKADAELLDYLQQNRPPRKKPEDGEDPTSTYVLSSGAVGCVVLVRDALLHIANLGDCRVIVSRDGDMASLTADHRPEVNPDERERLNAMGVEVSSDGYLHGRIGVSRAFGDWAWDAEEKCKGLLCTPDVSTVEVTSDTEFLLLGCDGIFEKMTTKEAGQIVRRSLRSSGDPKLAAEALVKNASKRNGSDNLSALVVLFKRPPDPSASSERQAPRLFGRPRVTLQALEEDTAAAPADGEKPTQEKPDAPLSDAAPV